ncbi:ATP-dependent DNA helicase PIF1-like [Rhizophagus irregularis DAOM 181602=DAOM 197198]|nr:ATP-dependent DNA helicase PIF1-like [Rhizophagus irregularis DAOM 181602=DAOM 197198]
MYSQDSRKSDHLSEDSRNAYQEIYKLEAMQRQTGNSDKQQQFRNLSYHLRDGKSTRSDWELLMTRIPENIPKSEKNFFMF